MARAELITITGTGTRSVEKFLTEKWSFVLNNRAYKKTNKAFSEKEWAFNSTHFSADRNGLDRILAMDNIIVLSTWRDPLRTVIHNLYKGRKKIMDRFPQLMELRRAKPVIMIDLKCIPYMEGAGEVDKPIARIAMDGGALRDAYFAKDINMIEKAIGKGWEGVNMLQQLRDFDWEGLPVEDWWQ